MILKISKSSTRRNIILVVGFILLIGIIVSGVAFWNNANTAWDNYDTWEHNGFKLPDQNNPDKRLYASADNGVYSLSTEECILYTIDVTDKSAQYNCSLKSIQDFVNGKLTKNNTILNGEILIPDIAWRFEFGKDQPQPDKYLDMQIISERSFSSSLEEYQPIKLKMTYKKEMPEKSFLNIVSHYANFLMNKKDVVSYKLLSWSVEKSRDLGADGFYPVPTEIPSDISFPWGHSRTVLNPAPAVPDVQTLDVRYREIKKAVESRNYNLFKQYGSSERIWFFDNFLKPAGQTAERHSVYKMETGGESYFKENGICGLWNTQETPLGVEIEPGEITDTDFGDQPDTQILLIDNKTGAVKQVRFTDWEYKKALTYKIKDGQNISGTGVVYFVYDKGQWRYHGELWKLSYDKNNVFGDNAQVKTTTVGTGKPNDYPGTIRIKRGEAVEWGNVYGNIVGNPDKPWQSFSIIGAKYKKVFTERGTYEYKICQARYGGFTGKVIVE